MQRLCLLLFLITILAVAQTGTGSISGRISDPTGAVIPGARIVATNLATQVATETISNSEGIYNVLQLVPGNYKIEADASGFKKSVKDAIQLRVADRLTLDFSLTVGSQAESIVVTGEMPLLRTEDAQTGEVINNTFIQNMPQLNRNPLNLLRLAGNVQGGGGPGGDTRINGGRTSGVEFFVDGVPMSSGRGHSVTELRPSMDSVQEFKVVTNGISAEIGRISGGYVEVATKGGTNTPHGQVYEYMYNDMFNAQSWSQNALGNKKTHFRQNNYGFVLGGPVYVPKVYNGKNRTFFNFDYDIFHNRSTGALSVMSVPTAEERAGDFTKTFAAGKTTFMYDPDGPQREVLDANGKGTGVWERILPLGGDGKHVPSGRISPVSAAILKVLPMPNRAGNADSSSSNNYQAPGDSFNDTYRYGLRVDHMFGSNHRFFSNVRLLDNQSGNARTGGPLSTASTGERRGGRWVNLNYDWTVRPTFLLNFRAGVNHDPNRNGSLLPSDFSASSLGFPAIYQQILGDNNLPNIQIDFMNNGYYGRSASGNVNAFTTWHGGATASKMLGRHFIRFGYEHRRYYDNFSSFGGTNVTTFTTNPVHQFSGDHGFGSNDGKVNGLGSFLLGINSWNIINGMQTRAMNLNYHAAFVQDDFRVSSKLTVNVGLRWDVETPTTERHDKMYFWDPDAPSPYKVDAGWTWEKALSDAGLPASLPKPGWVTNGFPNGAVRLANTPEFPGRSGQTVNPHQFAPRLGVAYQITDKTVFRGSADLIYLSTTGDPGGFSRSNSSITTGVAADAGWHASDDGQRNYISTWANPFPKAAMITKYQRDNFVANQQSAKDPGVSVFNRHMHMPREYVWNLSVQRELPYRFVVETGYSGNRGLGLLAPNPWSQFPKTLLSPDNQSWLKTQVASPTGTQSLATSITGPKQMVGILEYPYPYFGFVNVLGSNLGASTFHALNVRVERRLTDGVSLLLNYTMGRNLDNVGGPEAGTGGINTTGTGGKNVQSVDSFQSSWGLSAIDQTHRLSFAYYAEIPIGKGKKFLGSPQGAWKILDGAIGGWKLSGFTMYRSGTPLNLTSSNCQNCTNVIKVETLFGRWASANHDLGHPGYTGDKQVLVSSKDPRTTDMVRRIDPAKLLDSKAFIYGDLPSIYDTIRNPAWTQTDLSLGKSFGLWAEGRFLEVRMEASNIENRRGFGGYNMKIGDRDFGLITSAGNGPRNIQMSARIVF